MTIKPFIIAAFLTFPVSASSSPGPQPAKPAKSRKAAKEVKGEVEVARKKPIKWNNTPFKEVLSELAKDFRVEIYNPKNIDGIPLTGTGSGGESITVMCLIITREEKGHAYLLYQNGVVCVSDQPFPPDFIHAQKQ